MLSERRKQKNRDNLGAVIKDARTHHGYTQKALADQLGIEYYTTISQIENGHISIPAALWSPLADALRLDKSDWLTRCLCEYHPEVFNALFSGHSRKSVSALLTALRKGQIEIPEVTKH